MKVAVVFLQPFCNMNCSFCITEDNFSRMTFQQATGLLDRLEKENFKSLVIGGGEPTLWPGLFELAFEAKRRGFFVQLGTNGIVLNEDFAGTPSIDRFVLPLESMVAAVHNGLRIYSQASHHDIILKRLSQLRNAGRSVTISTIVTAPNVGDARQVGEFLRQYHRLGGKIHAWHIYKFLPRGRGGGLNAASLEVTEDAYEKLFAELKALELPFKLFKRKDMYHSKEVDFFWYEGQILRRGSQSFSEITEVKKSAE